MKLVIDANVVISALIAASIDRFRASEFAKTS